MSDFLDTAGQSDVVKNGFYRCYFYKIGQNSMLCYDQLDAKCKRKFFSQFSYLNKDCMALKLAPNGRSYLFKWQGIHCKQM